jgi:hypothetical protein
MSSADKLTSAIESVVREYIKTKYNVTLDDLLIGYMSFRNLQDKIGTLALDDQRVPEKKTVNDVLKAAPDSAKKQKVSAKDKPKCIHPIAKGEKKGQPCGVAVSDESKSGNYCKKHLTQETAEAKAPAKSAVAPKKKEDQPLNKFTKEELKEKIEKRTTEIEVRRNKFGNWEHQGSGILIDRDTRKAYGKQEQDGSVSPLTEEDIELCKSIGFKYVLPDNIKSKNEDREEDDEDMEDEDLDIDDEIEDEEDD